MDSKFFVRQQLGGMYSIVDAAECPGNIWWVGSGVTAASDTAGFGRNPDAPFATLVYAKSAAAAGDRIYVLPAHAETLLSATGAAVLTCNLAGLEIIGLGGRSRKPAFLIDGHANNYVTITGADTKLVNLGFKAGAADIVKGINVAAAGVEIIGCSLEENIATENFLVSIQTTAAADQLLIKDCFITTVDAAGTEGIELVGACNSVTLENNYIKGPFSVSCISAITNACLDMQIVGNRIINTLAGDDLAGCIDLVAGSTGMIADNRCYMEDNTDCLTSIDGANCGRVNNLCANEYGQEANYSAAQSA